MKCAWIEELRRFHCIFGQATGTVGDEDVPTIFRYLNVFIPDKEYAEKILPDLLGDEPAAFVRYERFEANCIALMDKHAYEPDPEVRAQNARIFSLYHSRISIKIPAGYLAFCLQGVGP